MIRTMVLMVGVIGCQMEASSQIVQLPSFRSFGYTGTVVVPDGGTVSLGGNTFSSYSRSQRAGLFPGPVIRSGQSQIGNASASATIIDHQAIDRQLLGQTPQQLIEKHEAIHWAADRRSRGMKAADPTEEGKSLVRYARTLYQQRRYDDARHAYEMAISVLDSPLQQLAIAEMQRLSLRR